MTALAALSGLLSAAPRAKFLSFLVPSFLPSAQARPPTGSHGSSHGGIATLDGLRGVACLFVLNEHFLYNYSTVFLSVNLTLLLFRSLPCSHGMRQRGPGGV